MIPELILIATLNTAALGNEEYCKEYALCFSELATIYAQVGQTMAQQLPEALAREGILTDEDKDRVLAYFRELAGELPDVQAAHNAALADCLIRRSASKPS